MNFKKGLILGLFAGGICFILGLICNYFISFPIPMVIGVSIGTFIGNFFIHGFKK